MSPAIALALMLNPSALVGAEGLQWTCRRAVYELSQKDGVLYARTSGGIVEMRIGRTQLVSTMPTAEPKQSPDIKGDGAFLSASTSYNEGSIVSFWGGKNILYLADNSVRPLFPRPPASGEYALLNFDNELYAGTDRGLFVRRNEEWQAVDLGGELPFPRVHGIAKLGEKYVLGGTEGAAFGIPGNWLFFSKASVRQIALVGKECWVLYGSGAIDIIDARGNVKFDTLHNSAKRPWASFIMPKKNSALLGGSGGWMTKGKRLVENYPQQLRGQVVTAIASVGDTLYIGTQGIGLITVRNGNIETINPGRGLSDSWVTALAVKGKRVYAATATAGLFEIKLDRATSVETPSKSLRYLHVWNGKFVIGSLDGAWLEERNGWRKLPTAGRETTSISAIGGRIWVGTPDGIAITK